MRVHAVAARDQVRNHIAAEIVLRQRFVRIADQLLVEEHRVEHVDAHAREGDVGASGDRLRMRRLFLEARDPSCRIDLHDAQRRGVGERHLDAGDRHVGVARGVVDQHPRVVHLVDVVAGQHEHVLGRVAAQQIEVLVDRVGGALVPVRSDALLGGQELDEIVEAAVEERPAPLHMANQALRLVLRADAHAPDAGIHAVRQREVDDAELAAERHRGLGPPVGQRAQPRAAAAGEDQRERVVRQPRTRRAGSLVLVHELAVTRTLLGAHGGSGRGPTGSYAQIIRPSSNGCVSSGWQG